MKLLVAVAACLLSVAFAQPPLGPRDKANCPVTGKAITISADTPAVDIKNGQQLFFSSKDAAATYVKSPRDYWLAPHDTPLAGMDGKRGLPDLRNTTTQVSTFLPPYAML